MKSDPELNELRTSLTKISKISAGKLIVLDWKVKDKNKVEDKGQVVSKTDTVFIELKDLGELSYLLFLVEEQGQSCLVV